MLRPEHERVVPHHDILRVHKRHERIMDPRHIPAATPSEVEGPQQGCEAHTKPRLRRLEGGLVAAIAGLPVIPLVQKLGSIVV